MVLQIYYLKPTGDKIVATLLLFTIYVVFMFFILTMQINSLMPLLLFILYLFGGPASIAYMFTSSELPVFIAIAFVFLILYQYLLITFVFYLKEKLFKKTQTFQQKRF